MNKLDEKGEERKNELLEICKKYSGEYRYTHHGPGSWATTYSNDFIAAAAELWTLYEDAGSRWPYVDLSREFRAQGIRSCRGSDMSYDRVEYLYNTHLKKRIESRR